MANVDFKKLLGVDFDAAKITTERKPVDPRASYDEFLALLTDNGLIVDHLDTDKLVRCKTKDSKGKKPAWYVFHQDMATGFAAGAWGDWREGEFSNSWNSAGMLEQLSEAERNALQARIDAAKAKAEAERRAAQDAAATLASSQLAKFPTVIHHDYLSRKQVKAYGHLYQDPADNALIIPIYNASGDIRSYQRIPSDQKRSKLFLEDSETRACFYLIGQDFTHPTYVAEGYATAATVHELTGKSVAVVFYAGNIRPVIGAIKKIRPALQFVIAADNDHGKEAEGKANTGKATAEAICSERSDTTYKLPQFPAESTGTDWNDLVVEQGADVAKRQLVPPDPRGLTITKIGNLGKLEPTKWLVKDYIPEQTLGVLYGPSGHGKTFVALDFGLHIATGRSWHGRQVKQGVVVYIAGEGQRGIQKRVAAWCIHHGVAMQEPEFYVTNKAVPLLDQASLVAFIRQVEESVEAAGGQVDLVIVDTLARNFGDGNENATEDMNRFVAACDEIKHLTQSSVLVVHHTGLTDGNRMRGSSALKGAIDVQLKAEEPSSQPGFTRLTHDKAKDEEEQMPICFERHVVEVSGPTDPERITSCVLVPDKDPASDAALASAMLKGMRGNQIQTYEILTYFRNRALRNRPDLEEILVEYSELHDKLNEAGVATKNHHRYIKLARDKGWIRDHHAGLNFFVEIDQP